MLMILLLSEHLPFARQQEEQVAAVILGKQTPVSFSGLSLGSSSLGHTLMSCFRVTSLLIVVFCVVRVRNDGNAESNYCVACVRRGGEGTAEP